MRPASRPRRFLGAQGTCRAVEPRLEGPADRIRPHCPRSWCPARRGMPGHLEQMDRSIKRPLVLFIERWRFFASKRSGKCRFYCRRPDFMTEKNGDFHAIQIVRPGAPGQSISKYANWSVARMTYLPRKKARRGALWPLRNCRAGAVRAIWGFGLCLSLAACGSLGGMLGHGGLGGVAAPTSQAPP